MPAPRSTPRGPVDATGSIAERAFAGAVTSSLLLPILQLFMIEMFSAFQSLPTAGSQNFGAEIALIYQSTMLAVIVIPIVSTLGSMVFAYFVADWWGVGLYLLMSVSASAMLDASLTAALIFITGMFAFLIVAAVKMQREQSQRRPRRRLR